MYFILNVNRRCQLDHMLIKTREELLSFIWHKHLFIVAKKATKYSKDSFVLMKKGHVGPNPMNGKLSRGGFDITLLKKPSKWRLCSGQLDNHVHLFIPQFFHCLAVETISFRFIFFKRHHRHEQASLFKAN